jgi:hypothetical protein
VFLPEPVPGLVDVPGELAAGVAEPDLFPEATLTTSSDWYQSGPVSPPKLMTIPPLRRL